MEINFPWQNLSVILANFLKITSGIGRLTAGIDYQNILFFTNYV